MRKILDEFDDRAPIEKFKHKPKTSRFRKKEDPRDRYRYNQRKLTRTKRVFKRGK